MACPDGSRAGSRRRTVSGSVSRTQDTRNYEAGSFLPGNIALSCNRVKPEVVDPDRPCFEGILGIHLVRGVVVNQDRYQELVLKGHLDGFR